MNESDSKNREQALWIERGEVLGHWLKALRDSRLLVRVWKAPSSALGKLLHRFDHFAWRHRSMH